MVDLLATLAVSIVFISRINFDTFESSSVVHKGVNDISRKKRFQIFLKLY